MERRSRTNRTVNGHSRENNFGRRTKNALVVSSRLNYRKIAEPRKIPAQSNRPYQMAFTARILQNWRPPVCAPPVSLSAGRSWWKGTWQVSLWGIAVRLAVPILIWFHSSAGWAAEPVAEDFSEDIPATASSDSLPTTEGQVQSLFPVLISLGLHTGYDSNSRTTANSQSSWFTSQELTLSYDRLRGPTKIELVAGGEAIERFSRNSDVNAFLNFSATHEISPRLSLSGNIDSAYRAEPDFTSDVGPTQRQGNYFRSSDGISATYQWADRFSTVTSASFRLLRYENSSVALFTDREEYTFGEEFRFEAWRQTVLLADYRFLWVDYDSFPRDSTTHFALAGVEQTFTPRLTAQMRAGASFRSFEEGEDSVDPDLEGSLDYALARYSSLSWNVSYRVEEPSAQEALSRKTFRTGLELRYGFTAKFSSAFGLAYHHDVNMGGTGATAGPSFSTDAYDLTLSARYQLRTHWDLDASFQHTQVSSGGPLASYSRNRYSVGINFTF
jgi:hypothetical protein